ncbi:heat-inducible transcriptional repressor HrcA [Fretibacter rubidus]|uniref:heat-inducible transcriptional repressor HrcA n=1 Tax=Fretibacter rubidus TaxID=570162 RepID=UPI00352AB329
MSLLPPHMPLVEMDARARDVFRDIVQSYLESGQPIGSRTLALSSGLSLSPASIRNTMADLTRYGLLSAPHSSAGRMPTQLGLRLFVDGLLELGEVDARDRKALDEKLSNDSADATQLMEQASSMLAGLAGGAGLVLTPTTSTVGKAVRHVDFVHLDAGPSGNAQALVVLVYADGHVENRIMEYPDGVLPASLESAGNFLSARLRGRTLSDARSDILSEISKGRAEIDRSAANLIEQGLAAWSKPTKNRTDRALIVRGSAQLLDNMAAQTDLERIQMLFQDLERKQDLIALLDRAEDADGVKIFIGTENPLFSLSESSVVVAPYKDAAQNIIGAVGVIGPTRLNYGRIIPVVDYTAQLVGQRLDQNYKR